MTRQPHRTRAVAIPLGLLGVGVAVAALVAVLLTSPWDQPADPGPAAPATAPTTTPTPTDDAPDPEDVAVVVGPRELEESGVWREVVEQYVATNPFGADVSFDYVGVDTAAQAVELARSGRAVMLVVDDPDLERRFVADGYAAAGEAPDGATYGRSAFWTDYVLLGSPADPAGVREGAPYDLVAALERVAAAGEAGAADFVSRGGRSDTTATEHALWALTDGVPTCEVSAADGGGESPSTVTGPCPTPIPLPSWYHAVGGDQTAVDLAAHECRGYASRACYVLTDRGVSTLLSSQDRISGLRLVGRDSTAAHLDLRVRSWRVYPVNAAKFPGVTMNWFAGGSLAATIAGFEMQGTLAAYLRSGGLAPYRPASSPRITASTSPRVVSPGGTVVVSGYLTSRVPGGPRPRGVLVDLQRPTTDPADDDGRVTVARGRTNARGVFRIRYVPTATSRYFVAVDDFDLTVDPADPPYVVSYEREVIVVPSVSVRRP